MGAPPGLQADYEELLSRFQDTDSVRFEDFSELWRSMKFGTIFCGKMRNLEKNTFTKEALALAWQYFLPPYAFQIRVGALYLLYGLYNTQLCQPKQKIRVALRDWDEILKFQQDLINSEHFDVAYIFRKLRLDKAFHFTAMPKLLSFRMKKKVHRTQVTEEFKEPNDRVMKLITSDVLEEMLNVHDLYQNMKHVISADKSNPNKTLSLVKDDFFDNIKTIILEHQQWHKDRKNSSLKLKDKDGEEKRKGNSQEAESCERAASLAKIKSKAFAVVAQRGRKRDRELETSMREKHRSAASCTPPTGDVPANKASKSRRHRQVKLDSSDSDSASGQGPIKATRGKRNKETLNSPGRKKSSNKRDDKQNVHKEDRCLSLSMPVITEDDEENGSQSETEVASLKRKRKPRTKRLV